MYAVFSTTASDNASLSFNLLSSLNACLQFLSVASWTWLLLSHVLRRVIVFFIDADKGFPVESLLACPITVASPMSCTARDVGIPVLALSSNCSFENDCLSGPKSFTISFTTNPHPPQNRSPVVPSVNILAFPHLAHRASNAVELCVTMNNTPIQLSFNNNPTILL